MKYVKSQDQITDILTKSLKFKDFTKLRAKLELVRIQVRRGMLVCKLELH